MKFAKPAVFVAAASLAGLAFASGNQGTPHAPVSMTAQASTVSDMTDGEVRKVDKESGKLTLKHGDIKSLDMPGMTMVFSVKDKAVLDTVKAGDKVRFKAVNDAGKFTVTEVQVVK
jgi:Cu(I)/Ag(I) efflux system protein CusF